MCAAEGVFAATPGKNGIDIGYPLFAGYVATSGLATHLRIQQCKIAGRFAVHAEGVVDNESLNVFQFHKAVDFGIGQFRIALAQYGPGLLEGPWKIIEQT